MSYAPVIALDLRTGQQRTATEREVRTLDDSKTVVYGSPIDVVTRRLSCSDPCDMREIWRLAARAAGATEPEALTALLDTECRILADGNYWLSIRRNHVRIVLHNRSIRGADLATATAALCDHMDIWGPK